MAMAHTWSPLNGGVPQVGWSSSSLDVQQLCVMVALWEALYQFSKAAAARAYKKWPKVASLGGSYFVAALNAFICSVAGVYIVLQQLSGDGSGHGPELLVIRLVAHLFLSWLLMDLVHLFTHFPTLGGWDMVAHHIGFICLTTLAYLYDVLPHAMGWMLLGEISSLFLNARWFLINSGRGESAALRRTNAAFAGTFFAFRVVVMWIGLFDLLVRVRPILVAPPYAHPPSAINGVCAFVVGSALLNLFWLVKIVRMASRSRRSDDSTALVSTKRAAQVRRDGSQEELSSYVGMTPMTPSSWPASPALSSTSPTLEVAVHRG